MSDVIINDIPPYVQAIAILNQTIFGTSFTADVASDIVVYVTPFGDEPDDLTQILAYPADFSVTFVGALRQVQVELVTPSAAGDIVTITRMTPADRLNLYNNVNFTPSMLNNDFGILTLVDQQAQLVNQLIGPRYNYSAIIIPVEDTILPILGANECWVKNNDNDEIVTIVPLTEPDISPVRFVVNEANGLVPASQSLGALSTGIVRNTSAAGVGLLSIDAVATSFANLPFTANALPFATGATSFDLVSLAPFSRTILPLNSLALWQTALGIPGGAVGVYLPLAGGTMTGIIDMGNNPIINVTDPTNPQDAATKAYVDSAGGAYLPLAGGTMTGPIDMSANVITDLATPVIASDAATKGYVDSVAQNIQVACLVTPTSNLVGYTYANGSSGVGATLTAGGNGAFTADGVSPAINSRILVVFQSAPAENGAYVLTTVGDAGTPAVLTRAPDYNESSEMQAGDIFAVVSGTTYGATQWMMSQTAAITIGTTPITFSQITGQGALLRANNLSDLISPSTARTNLGLGTGNSPTFTGLNLSGLTASQAVVTDSSKNLASLGYGSTNSASTLVLRDGSGNFSAGTITVANITMTGNIVTPQNILGSASTPMFSFVYTPSAVNGFTFLNNITTASPVIFGSGTDTNITLQIQGKGTGALNLKGTGTNDNAPAGFYGEFGISSVPLASAISITSTTPANITTVSLEAGDYDVGGNVGFSYSVGSTNTQGWISLTSATTPDFSLQGTMQITGQTVTSCSIGVPNLRVSIAVTTTVYLSCRGVFGSGTGSAFGNIWWRRRR